MVVFELKTCCRIFILFFFFPKLLILWMVLAWHELLGGYYFPSMLLKLEIFVLVRPTSDLEMQDLIF